jgi:hypothetical protein
VIVLEVWHVSDAGFKTEPLFTVTTSEQDDTITVVECPERGMTPLERTSALFAMSTLTSYLATRKQSG